MPSTPLDDDDDGELELEPIDPEVLAHDRQRGTERTETLASGIDVDELYRESQYSDLDLDLSKLKQFRFTTRHLLSLTGLLAIVLTMRLLVGACNTVFIVGVLLVAGGWFYVFVLERRQDAERERRREEFLANAGRPVAPAAEPPAPVTVDEPTVAARPRFDVKFAFNMKELMMTMTVAAVMMGALLLLGPRQMSIVLGVIALVGLVIQAAGFDAPRVVVLGWWLLLAMYLVVGLIAAARDEGKQAAMRPMDNVSQIAAASIALEV